MHEARTTRGPMRALLASLAVLLASLAVAAPANAAGTGAAVSIAPATADPDYATTLTLHGTGFQPIKGGWGGIYVFFGTVDGTWQPSKGGVSGENYLYVPDQETKDNHGYEKFVSFQDGGTLSAANGGVVNPDGTWSTSIVVPGAKFEAEGREGTPQEVDCLKVQCGIITIGAHGVVNDQNETFTPVTFAAPDAATSSAPAPASTAPPQSAAAPPPTSTPAAQSEPTGFQLSSISTPWWILGAAVAVALIALIAGLVSVGRARKGRTS